MRMARYDIALEKLSSVPTWFAKWPAVAALQEKARLGIKFNTPPQDWEALDNDLRRLRTVAPDDVDLRVFDATMVLRQNNSDEAQKILTPAVAADPNNAEAWYLLGYIQDLAGHVQEAMDYYQKAVVAAPESPQYRSNWARALLDTGKIDDAITEYDKIAQFPLARIEQALAYWSQGKFAEAAGAQGNAVQMLENDTLMTNFNNRRLWWFELPNNNNVRLPTTNEKLCYALLAESASLTLAQDRATTFPPDKCSKPPSHIRELLADNLCRYVDLRQPQFAARAAELREIMGQPKICPAAPQPKNATVGKTS